MGRQADRLAEINDKFLDTIEEALDKFRADLKATELSAESLREFIEAARESRAIADRGVTAAATKAAGRLSTQHVSGYPTSR